MYFINQTRLKHFVYHVPMRFTIQISNIFSFTRKYKSKLFFIFYKRIINIIFPTFKILIHMTLYVKDI